MKIKIPKRLTHLLEYDNSLHAGVLETLGRCESLIAHSHLPFFPEYTDHGLAHFESTLATAAALIPDKASSFSAGDACMLILATLLHDLGMHLTESGFSRLISAADFDPEAGWPRLWEEYFLSAKRFDGRTLKRLFGASSAIRRPPEDSEDWTKADRRLIGDFLRRNHPRLAQSIADFGMPSLIEDMPIISSLLPSAIRSLSGLVARSHGMDLRDALTELTAKFHPREFQGVHALYVMVLLRVGDYLQVQGERAPSEILKLRDIKSPISVGEWHAHQAIANITFEGADPEAIEIHAVPSNVATFLRLKDTLAGLQHELDISWAVLGEVYGRFPNLAPLGVEIRRVKSNLDDIQAFAKTVNYVPDRAIFEAADADLLRLLVEPLYGRNISLAVRELLQNSLDACRELHDYCHHLGISNPSAALDHDVEVLLSGDKPSRILTIRDHGIGMTAEVVCRYFLRAGASYRNSEDWKDLHADSEGKSRVLRSGRFGIGVLAAFLLGPKISVVTRHMTALDNEGICFDAELETDSIELKRCSAPIGTTIRIELSDDSVADFDELPQDRAQFGVVPHYLYFLDWPKVAFHLSTNLSQREHWPNQGQELSDEWHRISAPGYADIHWSYDFPSRRPGSSWLVCNGIAVSDASDNVQNRGLFSPVIFRCPSVSVFDPDANLPIDLARTRLATTLPFQKELFRSVCLDVLAHCLIDPQPMEWAKNHTDFRECPSCDLRGVAVSTTYILLHNGFTFPDLAILSSLRLKWLFYASLGVVPVDLPDPNTAFVFERAQATLGDCDNFVRSLYNPFYYSQDKTGAVIRSVSLTVTIAAGKRWPNAQVGKSTLSKLAISHDEIGNYILNVRGNVARSTSIVPPSVEYWFASTSQLRAPDEEFDSLMKEAMLEHLGTVVIPYDIDERMQRFPDAFKSLAAQIARARKARA
jgi:hypothetical protein